MLCFKHKAAELKTAKSDILAWHVRFKVKIRWVWAGALMQVLLELPANCFADKLSRRVNWLQITNES